MALYLLLFQPDCAFASPVSHGANGMPGQGQKILIVTSNQHTYGNTSISAANHFEEIVTAYDVFRKNGYVVVSDSVGRPGSDQGNPEKNLSGESPRIVCSQLKQTGHYNKHRNRSI